MHMCPKCELVLTVGATECPECGLSSVERQASILSCLLRNPAVRTLTVSYTHLRAHETSAHL
eukprot:11473925-Alexandrium_andersonii.AAC.1